MPDDPQGQEIARKTALNSVMPAAMAAAQASGIQFLGPSDTGGGYVVAGVPFANKDDANMFLLQVLQGGVGQGQMPQDVDY
jgi:hypothetical protein